MSNVKKGKIVICPTWKGGITPLRKLIYQSEIAVEWKKAIYKKDNYKCQKCGSSNNLEAHHIKSFQGILKGFLQLYDQFSPIEDKETLIRLAVKYEPFWTIDNGQTLCHICHKQTINYAQNLK